MESWQLKPNHDILAVNRNVEGSLVVELEMKPYRGILAVKPKRGIIAMKPFRGIIAENLNVES